MEIIRCKKCGRGISVEESKKYRMLCLPCHQKNFLNIGIVWITGSIPMFLLFSWQMFTWSSLAVRYPAIVADFQLNLKAFQNTIANIALMIAWFEGWFIVGWLAVKKGIAGREGLVVRLWDIVVILPTIVIVIVLLIVDQTILNVLLTHM